MCKYFSGSNHDNQVHTCQKTLLYYFVINETITKTERGVNIKRLLLPSLSLQQAIRDSSESFSCNPSHKARSTNTGC